MKARSAPGAPACAQPATAAELAHPTPDKREDRATAKRPRPEATPASSEVALVPQRDAPPAPAPRPARAARPAAAAAAWLRKLGEMHPACRAIPADEVIALALELFK
jgi:anti-sigma factor RsiW